MTMTQRGEEMKRLINEWTSSKKYAALKKEIKIQKQELRKVVGLNKDQLKKYVAEFALSKKELEKLIKNVFEFDALPEADQEEYDFISDLINEKKSAPDLEEFYLDFIRTTITWTTYIYIYANEEDFEFCADIKKLLEIEKKNFLQTLERLFGPSSEYEANVNLIIEDSNKLILE